MSRFEDDAPDGTRISDIGGEKELADRLHRHMLAKLEANRGKRHWQDATQMYLVERLHQEVVELLVAVSNGDDPWPEAADVANFAAMIADNASRAVVEPPDE